jgi:hypothetical protein
MGDSLPFHVIYTINTFVKAYKCTPLEPIHLLQRFSEKVLDGRLSNLLFSISLIWQKNKQLKDP